MKIFIDIGHPAHVHYFKGLIKKLSKSNHSFVITARDKEMTHYLLNHYKIKFISRGKGSDSFFGKFLYLIKTDYSLLRIAVNENPDLFLSFGSPYCAQVAYLLGKEHIAIDDTENASFGQLLYQSFSKCILTPDCFKKDFGAKHIKFPSYMELSYLHPNVFVPNKSIFKDLNIDESQKYVILRFVGWEAVHDFGHKGVSTANKIKAVSEFKRLSKVFISSETSLPAELAGYAIHLPPEKMHHALAFASLFYGESATMSSESAVLGTPAIYIDNVGRGYTSEQEKKYGMVSNFSESEDDQLRSIKKGIEILKKQNSESWNKKRAKLLNDKIDLTKFLVWFINNYPSSKEKLLETPKYMQMLK